MATKFGTKCVITGPPLHAVCTYLPIFGPALSYGVI